MDILLRYALPGVIALAMAASAAAAERSSKADAVALLHKAQAYLKEHGLERAAAEFNNADSPFNSKSDINKFGDLYLYSTDSKGFQLIHGKNARIRGTNKFDMRDQDGVYIIREFVKLCFETKEGRGWLAYHWPNPLSKEVEAKLGYVERVPGMDLCLGTGIYQ